MAKFLGKGKENQLQIFELVRKTYNLRSKIVHGGQLKPEERNFISDFEKLTKDATRKYLYALAEGDSVDWKNLLFD